MAAKQGHLIRKLAPLVERNNSKGTAAGGIPIHREVFGISLEGCPVSGFVEAYIRGPERGHLDEIRVPCIATNVQVVVTKLLSRRLPEDMPCNGRQRQRWTAYWGGLISAPAQRKLTILGSPDKAASHCVG